MGIFTPLNLIVDRIVGSTIFIFWLYLKKKQFALFVKNKNIVYAHFIKLISFV